MDIQHVGITFHHFLILQRGGGREGAWGNTSLVELRSFSWLRDGYREGGVYGETMRGRFKRLEITENTARTVILRRKSFGGLDNLFMTRMPRHLGFCGTN
jgi:hypothetical protein